MKKLIIDTVTGNRIEEEVSAEEIAQRTAENEAYNRDVLPGLLRQQAEQSRAAAYRSEADPLFFKAQRGEATTDEWTAKVAEIKARFPYPGGEA